MASRTSPPGTDSSPVVDIEDFVVESSVGPRNGSGQASLTTCAVQATGMWGGYLRR